LERSGRNTRNDSFLTWFVRPHGLDAPATPIFANTVEMLCRKARPAPRPDSLWARAARVPAFLLARGALALAEGRPVWVYLVRPPMTLAIHAAAVPYRVNDFWNEHARPVVKRSRRTLWRAWYESSQRLSHRWHRSKKRFLRLARPLLRFLPR
jgi:hypothetical protein